MKISRLAWFPIFVTAALVSMVSAEAQPAPETLHGLPLVFQEDFEDGRERWVVTDEASWTHREVDDNAVFGINRRHADYDPPHRSPGHLALIRDLEVADFVMTFRVRSTRDTGAHRDCCVFFNFQDNANFYYAHLGAKPDPHSGQIMIVDDAPRTPLTENGKKVPWDDEWHTVKVVRDSSTGTIDIYFDNMETPHMSAKDKTFGKGRIGIGSFDDLNDFDDVRVYAKTKAHPADVVVYGDASGGVTAAVQAARMGRSVTLVSQYGHLGGLSSSGLGWTDIGNDRILGGLSREFYHRLYQHYQQPEAWTQQKREDYHNQGQGQPALNPKTELASTFEPKVAEAVFDAMVEESGVKVIYGRIDLDAGVIKKDQRITAIRLEDGTLVEGRMFIDASYEGDLLPLAGVSFVTGRESNAEFNEQNNGNTGVARKNQLRDGIDPFVIEGDPASGLLPGVNPNLGGAKGEGDHRFQAYCYRMVLTDAPGNRVMVGKPEVYDEADYEILFRAIEAGKKWGFFKTSFVPNRKTDSNNTGGISTDYIGMNYGEDWNWATLDHEARETLAAEHREWQLGLVWTVQNHPRVPEETRNAYRKWGLAKDEFTDNGNWPYNLYVREARRMRSDFVMTENHCKHRLPVEDPVGMGAYTLDSHNTQRVVYEGMIKNEGDIQSHIGGKAYGISYRSIAPSANECENLLVPWALSATHIAFGSIRMEPVFMVLGQSAATAAVMAIEEDLAVQEVDYAELRAKLVADGQKLEL